MNQAAMHVGDNQEVYKMRRATLLKKVKAAYPEHHGILVLCGGFEMDRIPFRQDSFFYYFTGIREPGVLLTIDMMGKQTLWVPQYQGNRAQWVTCEYDFNNATIMHNLGIDTKELLGDRITGYSHGLPVKAESMQNFIDTLRTVTEREGTIFTVFSSDAADGVQQRLLMEQLKGWIPALQERVVDVTSYAAALRRCKDVYEIGALTHAIEITQYAQEAAMKALAHGVHESEIKGHIEYVFAAAGTRAAFPSIVAAGRNGTILHYVDGAGTMHTGDLVVIDIGAESDGYAADITRTYPVSGKFTPRQQELYTLVLDVQAYIADLAKPGMWLSYKQEADQSLNHLAHTYMERYGYGDFFPHGIGHFLGLDVHDVGDYSIPLKPGDVITIEPGIYIEREGIGIRIEDDYWVTERGVMCLSDDLPRQPEELCAWMEHGRTEPGLGQ